MLYFNKPICPTKKVNDVVSATAVPDNTHAVIDTHDKVKNESPAAANAHDEAYNEAEQAHERKQELETKGEEKEGEEAKGAEAKVDAPAAGTADEAKSAEEAEPTAEETGPPCKVNYHAWVGYRQMRGLRKCHDAIAERKFEWVLRLRSDAGLTTRISSLPPSFPSAT